MRPIIKSKVNLPLNQTNNLKEVANDVAARTDSAIKTGINKSEASNGTPMENLHGAARTTAMLKNIGKESKTNGGMNEGIDTIILNTKANTIIQTLDFVEKEQTQKTIESDKEGDE